MVAMVCGDGAQLFVGLLDWNHCGTYKFGQRQGPNALSTVAEARRADHLGNKVSRCTEGHYSGRQRRYLCLQAL